MPTHEFPKRVSLFRLPARFPVLLGSGSRAFWQIVYGVPCFRFVCLLPSTTATRVAVRRFLSSGVFPCQFRRSTTCSPPARSFLNLFLFPFTLCPYFIYSSSLLSQQSRLIRCLRPCVHRAAIVQRFLRLSPDLGYWVPKPWVGLTLCPPVWAFWAERSGSHMFQVGFAERSRGGVGVGEAGFPCLVSRTRSPPIVGGAETAQEHKPHGGAV